MNLEKLAEYICNITYNAYGATFFHAAPLYKKMYERMTNPVVGDLIVEQSTHFMKSNHLKRVGIFLRKTREDQNIEGWNYKEDGIPYEDVYYIENLEGTEVRWVNANFIVAPTWLRLDT